MLHSSTKLTNLIIIFLFSTTCFATKCNKISHNKPQKPKTHQKIHNATSNIGHAKNEKTTFIAYIAADNDLSPFADRNLKQMEKIGSNENINIFVHIDMHKRGEAKITKHFIIEKGKRTQIGPDMCMDSGDPETLIYAVKLAVEHCPADNYILDLWNHGTGPLEPTIRKSINPSYLFCYNEKTKLIELDRSISFLDYINEKNEYIDPTKGICFDDSTGNYLTNEKLRYALNVCTRDYTKKKFSIIGCDACLMSMIEIASVLKDFSHVMVGSQEVELGTGWDYSLVLAPYLLGKPERHNFASHIVQSYSKAYNKITHDYTQSAINLDLIPQLEQSFSDVVQHLIDALKNQRSKSVKDVIKSCRHRHNCTHFDEITYIDLNHFLTNLIENISKFELVNQQDTLELRRNLHKALTTSCEAIAKIMIDNAAGPNLKRAKGISIYFPEYQIHSSYKRCEFAQKTNWLKFLNLYLG